MCNYQTKARKNLKRKLTGRLITQNNFSISRIRDVWDNDPAIKGNTKNRFKMKRYYKAKGNITK